MLDYHVNNLEVTFILQMPVWWGYAASFPFAVAGCVVYAWRLIEDFGLATPADGPGPGRGGALRWNPSGWPSGRCPCCWC